MISHIAGSSGSGSGATKQPLELSGQDSDQEELEESISSWCAFVYRAGRN
jgi:hypothetical protein